MKNALLNLRRFFLRVAPGDENVPGKLKYPSRTATVKKPLCSHRRACSQQPVASQCPRVGGQRRARAGQFVTFDNESWIGDNPRIGDRHLQGTRMEDRVELQLADEAVIRIAESLAMTVAA
jgi:hypothetical protein